ncbi:MAG: asparaginase domain-containing protein [Patescibacteria group bacterium]|jgi:L-asparaginase
MPKEKKICLLFFGDYCPKDGVNSWLDSIPELRVLNKIEPIFVFGKNTAEIAVSDWLNLAQIISDSKDKYDGFVVLHNLENLLFTSAAISFLLPNITNPIVFTGGLNNQNKDSGIKSNIINSCQLAGYSLAEVCLLFGNKILRANQASRNYASSLNLFQASSSGSLGQIDFSIRIFNQARKDIENKARTVSDLEENILMVEANPMLSIDLIKDAVKSKKALFVKADVNQISCSVANELEEAAKKIPVVVFTQKRSEQFSDRLIVIYDMTLESSVTKLMWSLKQSAKPAEIKVLMHKNLAGEIII